MKKFIVLSVALMSLFYYTKNAQADLLIEPYIGYHATGESKSDTDGIDGKDLKGNAFGGRLGYQNLGFMLGLNFQQGALDVEDISKDLEYTTYGAFIGFNFPVLLRVWGEYVFSGSGELGDVDIDTVGGYRLGVGFTALPFVSINLEMSQPKVEFKNDADGDFNTYLLSISLPITL